MTIQSFWKKSDCLDHVCSWSSFTFCQNQSVVIYIHQTLQDSGLQRPLGHLHDWSKWLRSALCKNMYIIDLSFKLISTFNTVSSPCGFVPCSKILSTWLFCFLFLCVFFLCPRLPSSDPFSLSFALSLHPSPLPICQMDRCTYTCLAHVIENIILHHNRLPRFFKWLFFLIILS